MDHELIEQRIEAAISDARATVTAPRPNDDDHLAADVVSPAFEGKSLIEQHEMVYDAVDEHMITDIHALKISTQTPEDAEG